MEARMKIHSIFESISGETGPVIPQGAWVTFIRLQGCNLRCDYCDAKDAQILHHGTEMSINTILSKVIWDKVIITGGEPFLQDCDLAYLIRDLLNSGCTVQVETNGSFEIPINVDWQKKRHNKLGFVMDYKLNGADELKRISSKMIEPVLMAKSLKRYPSVLKFVVASEQDVLQAIEVANELVDIWKLKHTFFAFSPVDADLQLTGLIKDNVLFFSKYLVRTQFIINLQIHKLLNFL
jgi:7-carboxy-7-deazaguanine synthase